MQRPLRPYHGAPRAKHRPKTAGLADSPSPPPGPDTVVAPTFRLPLLSLRQTRQSQRHRRGPPTSPSDDHRGRSSAPSHPWNRGRSRGNGAPPPATPVGTGSARTTMTGDERRRRCAPHQRFRRSWASAGDGASDQQSASAPWAGWGDAGGVGSGSSMEKGAPRETGYEAKRGKEEREETRSGGGAREQEVMADGQSERGGKRRARKSDGRGEPRWGNWAWSERGGQEAGCRTQTARVGDGLLGKGRTADGECTGQGKKKRTGCTGNGTEVQGAELACRHSRWADEVGGGARHRHEMAVVRTARGRPRRPPPRRRRGALAPAASARAHAGVGSADRRREARAIGVAPHAPMGLRRCRRPPARITRGSIRGVPGPTASVLHRAEGGRRVTPPPRLQHGPNTDGPAPAAAAGTFHTASAPARGERWTGHANGDALVAAGLAAWLAGMASLPALIGTGDETGYPKGVGSRVLEGGAAERYARVGGVAVPLGGPNQQARPECLEGPERHRGHRRLPCQGGPQLTRLPRGGAVSGGAPLQRHNLETGDRRP